MSKKIHKAFDGFKNMLTGLGTKSFDQLESTVYSRDRKLDYTELGELHSSDGLSKRVINLPIQDAFREGFTVKGDTGGEAVSQLKKSGLYQDLVDTVRWADVFGGALMFLGIKDGGESNEPVNEKAITEITFARVYDRYSVVNWTIDTDIKSSNYGRPLVYTISDETGETLEAHYTRVIRVDGEKLTNREFIRNGYWHDSVYQSCFRSIKRVGTGYINTERAMGEMYIYVMKMQGLLEMLSQGDEEEVTKRLMHNDMTRNMMNMIGIDSETEELTRDSISLGGISKLLVKLVEGVSLDRGIPYSLLVGSAPKGLSTGDETGMAFYYDMISSKQEFQIKQPLQKLIDYQIIAMNLKLEDADGSVVFNDIERLSQKTIVETKKIQAETDRLNYGMGALFSEEIRDSRFGGTEYSYDTKIDENATQMTPAQMNTLEV